MPVYEEKVISPLAVRFSQEHIRTTFRNSLPLDDVVALVEAQEGFGPYDVVLKAPFPNIEVARWRPSRSKSQYGMASTPEDAVHWFAKDNRRLYVLQRAATKLWPKKVGVEVDVLFTVPSELLKKYDSSTAGLFAALGESHCKSCIWNWMSAVSPPSGSINMFLEKAAMRRLELDDSLCTLTDLVSLPRAAGAGAAGAAGAPAKGSEDETFTASTSSGENENDANEENANLEALEALEVLENEPFDSLESEKNYSAKNEEDVDNLQSPSVPTSPEGNEAWPPFDQHWKVVSSLLRGVWRGPKGESYQLTFDKPGHDSVLGECLRSTSDQKPKPFSVCYEYATCLLWWGTQHKFCLDPEELRYNRHNARWYVAGKEKPEFEWDLVPSADGQSEKSRRGRAKPRKEADSAKAWRRKR
ncbi:unnamed protein product [Effrenium voratum]|uniref:Uncharacterized protein n=1 Tax=Effrenium voratum TaxID=2562239 RepID=A0AA36MY36_9DINO|nr:unnamed protein product [Effrenium voratum]CAJ1460206.1 unnamed protein product [Effrenium voratum]